MTYMTYKELEKKIATMTEKQKNTEVTAYLELENDFLSVVKMDFAKDADIDFRPFLVVENVPKM